MIVTTSFNPAKIGLIQFEDRPSDSPFIERIWRSHSEYEGNFVSVASNHLEMVVTHLKDRTFMTVRGPETKATPVFCPPEGEWVAIRFKMGTFMPHLPITQLIDGANHLPGAGDQSFWLHGASMQFPTYENADTFVNHLIRYGLLVHDPIVDAVLQNRPQELSLRSAQRRFLRATGLTYTAAYQIQRARYATQLLRQGSSILDTIEDAGYFDQPHLTRSMRRLIGQTPAQLVGKGEPQQLSFLYKTSPF